MQQITDFDTFYNLELLPSLAGLREQSRASKRWFYMSIASAIMLGVYIFIRSGDYREDKLVDLPIVFLIILLIVSIGFNIQTKDNFEISFKESIIKKILDFIQPGLQYEPEKYLNSKHYKNSCLYRARYVSINGDDLFQGFYKNVPFKCSEINTVNNEGSIFSGLFFYARISNFFSGGTYVWSKGNAQYANSVYTEHYRFYPMPKVAAMKMHDEEFDKHFSTCSTYPDEARQILTPERMQQMVNFCTKINADISFSFVGGYCYVAVPQKEGLFESGKDPGDKTQIKQYFLNIILFLSFIDKLKLNEML